MSAYNHRTGESIALGQHNLRNERIAHRIVASTGLAPPDLVFDLGAGRGTLTEALAARCGRVVAVELDRSQWLELKRRFAEDHRVTVLLADLVAVEFPRTAPYHIVANIPYGLTADIIRKISSLSNPPRTVHLVIDRRAGQKWAVLGHETLASVLLKIRFHVDVVLALRRTDFVPYANVDSVVMRLRRRPSPVFVGEEARRFEAYVRRSFGSGRQSPGNGRTARMPHELSFEDWIDSFRKTRSPRTPAAPRLTLSAHPARAAGRRSPPSTRT